MSRSCHRPTSSKAACTFERTTRARPQICSQVTGLRLCGMAELPFWPRAKYSSASRTSVRCKWRTSSAIFSHSAVASASAATKAACRSRWITCEVTGAACRPSRAQIRSSTSGPMWAKVPTAPEDLADAQILGRGGQAFQIAPGFFVPDGQFEAERDRLGVHAVGAAHLHGAAEFERAPFQDQPQRFQIAFQDGRRLHQQQRLRRIHHVIRGQPVVQPARGLGVARLLHALRHRGGEGDHVVLHFALDFENAGHVEAGVRAQQARRLGRDRAQFGERLGGRQLHLQPLLKLILVTPDPAHGRPRVARNHVVPKIPSPGHGVRSRRKRPALYSPWPLFL